jgi:hypothetical protein
MSVLTTIVNKRGEIKGCEHVRFPERSRPWIQKDIVSPSLTRRHFYTQKHRRVVTARWAAGVLADVLIQEALSSTLFLAMTALWHSGGLACKRSGHVKHSVPHSSMRTL